MLAPRGHLTLPMGTTIDLPRLVPSFSSKGFPFFEEKETGRSLSEVTEALEMTGPTINDSILISSYDIYHQYLRDPQIHFGNKELVVIDSGGYELSPDFDSTEPKHLPHKPNVDFNLEAYREVLSDLPSDCPIAITNFDYQSQGLDLESQIAEAQELFNDYPQFLHGFIIKPSKRRQYIDIDEAIHHIEKMRLFHIIGFTEQELGNSLLDRLTSIANLRLAMIKKSMLNPIHIWGGLDPIVTPLYFSAGAEIFDGLSWLRYGYYNDSAIPRDAYTALDSDVGIQTKWRRAYAMRLAKNLSFLTTLTYRMRQFADRNDHDFTVFGAHAEALQRAYEILCTKVGELRGDQ